MTNNCPRISIIIPVLNAEKTLEKAIKSILDQHYENLELLILDAGSNDGTLEIIKRYETQIAYWHSKPDKGGYDAVNQGIQKATGEWIGTLMADDWHEPDMLFAVAKACAEDPAADIISCGGRLVSYDEKSSAYKIKQLYVTEKQLKLDFYNVCYAAAAICARFFKKALYEKIGMYHLMGHNCLSADKDFLLRTIVCGAKNKIVPHLGYTFLAHEGSRTYSAQKQNILRLYEEHKEIAREWLQKDDLTLTQRFFLTRWYIDQSIRQAIRTYLLGNKKEAFKLFKKGVNEFHIIWFLTIFYTWYKIILKKVGLLKNH